MVQSRRASRPLVRVPDVTFVVPAYGDAALLQQTIPPFLRFLRHRVPNFELIVCDDGSNDDGATETVTREFGCRFLRLPKNRGKGAAVRAGFAESRGRWVFFTDSDIPYAYEDVATFLANLNTGSADLVVGNRRDSASEYFEKVPRRRQFASSVFSQLIRWLSNDVGKDTQCGLKGMRGDVARALAGCLTIDGFAFDVELLALSALWGLRIARLPVRLRNNGRSHIRILSHGVRMFRDVLKLLLRFRLVGTPSRPLTLLTLAEFHRQTAGTMRLRDVA